MKKLWLLSVYLILLSSVLVSIPARGKPDFTTLLDAIYVQQVEAISYEILRENLWEFYQHPIDLNKASREDLELLYILTDTQLDCFFEHLEKNGALVSIYELQAIPEFDLPTIYQLIPFVQVQETYPRHFRGLMGPSSANQRQSYWLGCYERMLETKQGYRPNQKTGIVPYVGSPDKVVTRLKCRHPQGFGWGLSARKYAGEAFTWDPTTARYGFDVWSAYFLMENKSKLKTLVLGDYQVGYGQGLVVSSGFNMDKSSETIPIMRTNNLGIKPHTSAATYGFRGVAATLQWKPVEVTTYYAYTDLDGKVLEGAYVRRVQRNMYHRTETDIDKKGQVNEQLIGSTIVYHSKGQGAELGLNTLYSQYSIPIQPSPNSKNPWSFCGQDNFNLGLFYRYLWQNINFFGEGAISKSGGKAVLAGLVASLSARTDVSLLLRHYAKDFHNLYGDAFRANSSNSNERGIYLGLKLQPTKKLTLYAYYDYFRFPEPITTISEPSSGYDWLAKATYQLNRPTLLLFQRKEVAKPRSVSQTQGSTRGETAKLVATGKNSKYKAQLKHTIGSTIGLNSEVQWGNSKLLNQTTRGYTLVQSAAYKITRKLSITGQVAWFDTDYTNRFFFYEKDVLYSRPMPSPYHKKGMKYYILLCYKPTPSWRLDLKYVFTWYKDETSMGSGREEVEGNIKNEVKLQAVFKF